MDEFAGLPPVIMPEPPVVPPPPEPQSFVFHGSAREYFRIWIVNLALTLGTLGLYAAWAKVRRRRYFRGNLELMGHRFDYTARPERLLVGNLIVLTFFLAYALFGAVYPWVRIVALLIGLCLLPWIVVRSLAFNAYNTVYRGLRFRFHPSLSAATSAYILNFLPVLLTLGIYYPSWARGQRKFTVDRHRFGTGYFKLEVAAGQFYGAYLPAGLTLVFTGIMMGVATAVLKNRVNLATLSVVLTFGIYLPVLYLIRQVIHAVIFNAVWGGTWLDGSRFEASMSISRWVALQLGNWGAIIGTCGLLYPWAAVRNAQYTASCLRFRPSDSFYRIQSLGESGGSAVGDTAAEFIGLDFGL